MSSKKNILVSIVGPTAVGKTDFGIKLATYFNTEIISADSRQFYNEMEIGTAKPDEYELAQVKHHFINSHSIKDYYSAGRFEADALKLLANLFLQHRIVIVVGGSGLYVKSLCDGMDEMPIVLDGLREELNKEFRQFGLEKLLTELAEKDPEYYQKVDQQNHQRVIRALEVIRSTKQPFSAYRKGNKEPRPFLNIKIGLEVDRAELFDRINRRMDKMISEGLFEEAQSLYPFKEHNALQTVGYTEVFGFINGEYDKEEAVRLLKRNSRRYAKRQLTWFKKDQEVIWVTPDNLKEAIRIIENELNA